MNNNTVPGVLHCARCKFRLQRMVMSASTGAVGVDPNTSTERCPNGCGPLWPVTWEQEARELGARLEEFFDRAIAAEKALRELVELKRSKDALVLSAAGVSLLNADEFKANWQRAEEYERRKPAAWSAAFAIVDTAYNPATKGTQS